MAIPRSWGALGRLLGGETQGSASHPLGLSSWLVMDGQRRLWANGSLGRAGAVAWAVGQIRTCGSSQQWSGFVVDFVVAHRGLDETAGCSTATDPSGSCDHRESGIQSFAFAVDREKISPYHGRPFVFCRIVRIDGSVVTFSSSRRTDSDVISSNHARRWTTKAVPQVCLIQCSGIC